MPLLIFQWNDDGFNDVETSPGCRNGVAGQTKEAIIANLIENGAVRHNNIMFSFPNGAAIGTWARNLSGTLAWYEVHIFLFWVLSFFLVHHPYFILTKGLKIKPAFQTFTIVC